MTTPPLFLALALLAAAAVSCRTPDGFSGDRATDKPKRPDLAGLDGDLNLILLPGLATRDVTLERGVDGAKGAGLAARIDVDAASFYAAVVTPAQRLELHLVQGGEPVVLASVALTAPPRSLRLTVSGTSLFAGVDGGAPRLVAQDTQLVAAGRTGALELGREATAAIERIELDGAVAGARVRGEDAGCTTELAVAPPFAGGLRACANREVCAVWGRVEAEGVVGRSMCRARAAAAWTVGLGSLPVMADVAGGGRVPGRISGTLVSMPSRDAPHVFPVEFVATDVVAAGAATYALTYDLAQYGQPGNSLRCAAEAVRRGDLIVATWRDCRVVPTDEANPTECILSARIVGSEATGEALCTHYGPVGDDRYEVVIRLEE